MNKGKTISRYFLAIALETKTRQLLSKAIQVLKNTPQGKLVRWLASENLHLTIKFLGSAQKSHLLTLQPILTKTCQNLPPFRIELATVSLFPNQHPKVVVVDLAYSEPLLNLFAKTEQAAIQAGFESEIHPARPHITLGYLQDEKRIPSFNLDLTTMHEGFFVKSLTLFHSISQTNGPAKHEVVESYHLH